MSSQYQRSVLLEVRRAEGERVRAKHPDKIPIIVERAARSRAPELDKKKYLIPSDLTGDNSYSEYPMYCSTEHHEEDLFLYMTYSNESVYGA
ncbi:protein lgg-1-like [Xyrauchen texanus]|uniref:protein lgg-1-like n=1 Tax=Xyrauchen texanus TaxID=154827 RepID=UPI00224243E3|nr:protein lgg-1-like [Xyrauchen texanus]